MMRPVIYTLIGDAIATGGFSTLRDCGERQRERERERERGEKSSIMQKGAPVCRSGPGQSWKLPDAQYD